MSIEVGCQTDVQDGVDFDDITGEDLKSFPKGQFAANRQIGQDSGHESDLEFHQMFTEEEISEMYKDVYVDLDSGSGWL